MIEIQFLPPLADLYNPFQVARNRVEGELGSMKPGTVVEAEYDVPPEAWYFAENGYPTMPFCVLLEAHLQPCGWLALAAGVPRVTEEGLFFRNLDGQGTLLCEILPEAARLATRTRLTDVSGSGGMYLVSFEVEGRLQDQLVFRMTTGFGF